MHPQSLRTEQCYGCDRTYIPGLKNVLCSCGETIDVFDPAQIPPPAVGTPENVETLLEDMGVTTAVNCYPGISSSECYPEAYFFVDYLDDVMEKIEKHIKTCSKTNTVIIVGTKTHMYWHDILNKNGKMKKWFVDYARNFNKWTGKTMHIYSFEFGMMKP